MKKFISILLLTLPLSTQAYTIGPGIDDTDVGDLDILLGVAPKAGNPTAEEAWIESIVGDLDYVHKVGDNPTLYGRYANSDPNIMAAYILPGDDYYVLKNAQFMAAYKNTNELDWAVVDLAQSVEPFLDSSIIEAHYKKKTIPTPVTLGDLFNLNIDLYGPTEISHITVFDDGGNGGGTDTVPVPAPLALLGLGLLGLIAARRSA